MGDLARLKIVVDSKEAKGAEKDLTALGATAKRTEASTDHLSKRVKELEARLKQAENATRQFNRTSAQMGNIQTGLVSGFNRLKGAVLGLASAYTALQLIKTLDQYNVLIERIRVATKVTGDFVQITQQLSAITKETGNELQTSVAVFQRLALGAKDIGKSNKDVIELVRVVEQLGVIGGASGEALRAGLTQFGQAMSAGIVRAEEFNSVVENLPELANRIAIGLGTTTGQLRKMVIEGKVLSKDVFEALLKQAAEVDKQFKTIPVSLQRAWGAMTLNFTELISKIDKTLGLTKGLATAIEGASKWMTDINENSRGWLSTLKLMNDSIGTLISQAANLLNLQGPRPGGFLDRLGRGAAGVGQLGVALGVSGTSAAVGIRDVVTGRATQSQALEGIRRAERPAYDAVRRLFDPDYAREMDAIAARTEGYRAQREKNEAELARRGVASPVAAVGGGGGGDQKMRALLDNRRKFEESLNRETGTLKALSAARQKSEADYQSEQDIRESINMIAEKDLKYGDAKIAQLAQQVMANKELQRSLERIAATREQELSISQSQRRLSAFGSGGAESLILESDRIEAESRARGAGLDNLRDKTLRDNYTQRELQRIQTDRATEGLKVIDHLERETQQEQALTTARVISIQEYIRQKQAIEDENAARQAAISFTGQQREEIEQLTRAKAEESRVRQGTETIHAIQQEISNLNRLTEARKQGVIAYQETIRQIDIERQAQDLSSSVSQNQMGVLRNIITLQSQANKQHDLTLQKMEAIDSLNRQMGQALVGTFTSIATGARSAGDAIRDLAIQLALMLAKRVAIHALSGTALAPILGLPFAQGAAFSRGNVVPFARGGIVNRPTVFPMARGAGLMGEAGPEAVMPLRRLPGGDLGVQSMGGGGTVVNMPITVNGGGGSHEQNQDLARKIKTEMKITMDSYFDERQRQSMRPGGQYNYGLRM